MKKRLYIETTIPSFYCDNRTEPRLRARTLWTQQWWSEHFDDHECFTSGFVLDELTEGNYPNRDQAIELMRLVPLLEPHSRVYEISEEYIRRKVMPAKLLGDAMHLAMASYHRCDFLLIWNCSHLANENKTEHIEQVNRDLKLFVPRLITPLAFIGDGDNE